VEAELKHRMYASKKASRSNKRIVKALIEHAVESARDTGLEYFEYTSNYQTGNSFGERLANAFQDIFNKGYERVIALGNDCPYLDKEDILLANQKLQTSDIVLGPDNKGGAYLIGFNRSAFEQEQFEALPWQQNCLFKEFLNYCEDLGHDCALLDELNEVDNLKSLQLFIHQCRRSILVTLVRQFMAGSTRLDFTKSHGFSQLLETLQSLRAPPQQGY